jgi:hypothetical protein
MIEDECRGFEFNFRQACMSEFILCFCYHVSVAVSQWPDAPSNETYKVRVISAIIYKLEPMRRVTR